LILDESWSGGRGTLRWLVVSKRPARQGPKAPANIPAGSFAVVSKPVTWWKEFFEFSRGFPFRQNGDRAERLFDFTMAAEGVAEYDFHDPKLRERDPKKARLLYDSPFQPHPRAPAAMDKPNTQLAVVATMLRNSGYEVTLKALAATIGVSVATL